MTVKELIDILSRYDDDQEVFIDVYNYETDIDTGVITRKIEDKSDIYEEDNDVFISIVE